MILERIRCRTVCCLTYAFWRMEALKMSRFTIYDPEDENFKIFFSCYIAFSVRLYSPFKIDKSSEGSSEYRNYNTTVLITEVPL